MKRKISLRDESKKSNYIPPEIEATMLILEEGIAVGSAIIETSKQETGQIEDLWDTGTDRETELIW